MTAESDADRVRAYWEQFDRANIVHRRRLARIRWFRMVLWWTLGAVIALPVLLALPWHP